MHISVKHIPRTNLIFIGTDLGASPNYRDVRGLTPLYYSVTHATDPLLCEALLHDYAVIGASDNQGWQETHQVHITLSSLSVFNYMPFLYWECGDIQNLYKTLQSQYFIFVLAISFLSFYYRICLYHNVLS